MNGEKKKSFLRRPWVLILLVFFIIPWLACAILHIISPIYEFPELFPEPRRTPLHNAAAENRVDDIRKLLEKGKDIEAKDQDGWTPLHIATQEGSIDAVKLLIESGADVNVRDNGKRTPLHFAASGDEVEAIRLLISAGADIEARNWPKETPLHVAVACGNIDAIKFLLDSGAAVNARDFKWRTPLHTACRYKHGYKVEAIQLLIAAGADKKSTDKLGETAYDIARSGYESREDEEILELLKPD